MFFIDPVQYGADFQQRVALRKIITNPRIRPELRFIELFFVRTERIFELVVVRRKLSTQEVQVPRSAPRTVWIGLDKRIRLCKRGR